MYKALKVRLYPTEKQKTMLENHFNACRYMYNLCLEYRSMMWTHYKISMSAYSMNSEFRKIRNEIAWLKYAKSECIESSIENMDLAFKNFFKGGGYPKYKKKWGIQSFKSKEGISIHGDRLRFCKKHP